MSLLTWGGGGSVEGGDGSVWGGVGSVGEVVAQWGRWWLSGLSPLATPD
jgi:hypothetical protein